MQAAINAAGTFLPRDLPNPPIYSKTNPADAPILTLALTSTTLPLPKVEDLADTRLAQKISQLPGVGLVSISGGQKPAVRIQANPTALVVVRSHARGCAHGGRCVERQPGQGHASTDRSRRYTIGANDQLLSSDQYRAADRRLSERRAGAAVGRRDASSTASRTSKQAAWMNDVAGGHRQHPASARREHHRASSIASRRCCRS